MTMKLTMLKCLANFICGDESKGPVHRSSYYLTEFFRFAGFPQFVHDGSTRRFWVQDSLEELTDKEQREIVKKLVDPKSYKRSKDTTLSAINRLNKFLYLENIEVRLNGSCPELIDISDVEIPSYYSTRCVIPT